MHFFLGAGVGLGSPLGGGGEIVGGGATGIWSNAAPTVFVLSIVITQENVPEHAPLHPVKVDPEAGMAFSLTHVPGV